MLHPTHTLRGHSLCPIPNTSLRVQPCAPSHSHTTPNNSRAGSLCPIPDAPNHPRNLLTLVLRPLTAQVQSRCHPRCFLRGRQDRSVSQGQNTHGCGGILGWFGCFFLLPCVDVSVSPESPRSSAFPVMTRRGEVKWGGHGGGM